MTAEQLLSRIKHPEVRRMALEKLNGRNLFFDFLSSCIWHIANLNNDRNTDYYFWRYIFNNITEDGDLPADMESKFPEIFGNTENTENVKLGGNSTDLPVSSSLADTFSQAVDIDKLQQENAELKKRLEMYENRHGKIETVEVKPVNIDLMITLCFNRNGVVTSYRYNSYTEEGERFEDGVIYVTRRIQAKVLI